MKRTMNRWTIGLTGLLLTTFVAVAQQQPESKQTPPPPSSTVPQNTSPDQAAPAQGPVSGGPKLEMSQKEWDFGEVWQGEPAMVEVSIKNTGDAPLTIDVKSSCGCTIPSRPKSPLAPGESDKLKVSYNTGKRKGAAHQTITVITNDPNNRSVAFAVKGTVKQIYELKPADGLVFGALTADSIESRTVEVMNKYNEKMNLSLKTGADTGAFDVTIKELEPGMRWEITAKTKPPIVDGRQKAEITLLTQNAKVPEIKIPVNAFVQPPVSIRPSKLFLPKNSDKELVRSIWVSFNSDKPVKILGVKASPDIIKVEIPEKATAEKNQPKTMSYELKVTLPKGESMPADAKPTIEITTDSKDEKYQKLVVAVQMIDPSKAPPISRPGASGEPGAGPALAPQGGPTTRPSAPGAVAPVKPTDAEKK